MIKGLAAGTNAITVDLFNVSALRANGFTDPHQKLITIDDVYSLIVLEEKGLAAGTYANTVDLFNVSALHANGPRDTYQNLFASDTVYSLTVS